MHLQWGCRPRSNGRVVPYSCRSGCELRHGDWWLCTALGALPWRSGVPVGSPANETGLLLKEAGKLVLRRADGGVWRLDADRTALAMLGLRVRVFGVRSGFDLIDVARIERC